MAISNNRRIRMKEISDEITIWFTDQDALQGYNPHFQSPTNRDAFKCIEDITKTKGFLEPNYGGTNTILNVSVDEYKNLSPWSTNGDPCDGIVIKKEILKRDNMALLLRSRDNLMLMMYDDFQIAVISIGVNTLNQGILKALPDFKGNVHVAMSACIAPEHLCYDFDHVTAISNFHIYGYSDFVSPHQGNVHIDIREIVTYELKHQYPNFVIDLEDTRDTYTCSKLYSMREDTIPVYANCMIVW